MRFWHALRGLVRRRALERDLDAELQFHLTMATEQAERSGLSPVEARRQALARLGGLESTKEAARGARAYRPVEALLQDVRYGLRGLRRNPGYAAAAVLALAFGIGANTAVFSLVRGVLLRPLPYGSGERLVVLHQIAPRAEQIDLGFSVADLRDFRRLTQSFDGLAEYHSMAFNLLGHGEPERVQTGVVSANFFELLGVRPMLGRGFRAADEGELYDSAPPVLLLSHAYWQRRFGGDPAVVGQVFEMNGQPHTVIGVLPAVPGFPAANDVWITTSACPFRAFQKTIETRQARDYFVFGRLREGVSLAGARSELATTAAALAVAHPADFPAADGYTATAVSVHDELTAKARPTLLLLQVTVGLLLLIVCANVASLQLARLSTRRAEIAVRATLGASRRRLLRQLLTESLVVAIVGAALGTGIAFTLLSALVRFVARFTVRSGEIRLDAAVLLFTVATGFVAGVVAGAIPALAATRARLVSPLAGRSLLGRGPQGLRLRAALSTLQVAVSFTLLVSAGLTLRSVATLQNVDAGFEPQGVLAVQMDLDVTYYKTGDLRRAFFDALLSRVRALPGVSAAAISSSYPLGTADSRPVGLVVPGQPIAADAAPPQAQYEVAGPGFFQTVGVRLLRGRAFGPEDRKDSPLVVVINRSLAARLFGDADPIGRQIAMSFQPTALRTVVGVVADARALGLASPPVGTMWIDLAQQPPSEIALLLRGSARPADLVAEVRHAVYELDPRQPIGRSETLLEARSSALAAPRLTTLLLASFAGLALVVTLVGLGGVVAYGVAQRTQEIGVRMALGAEHGDVLRNVAREGLFAVGCGLATGAMAALLVARLLTGSLFGVQPSDPLTYFAVAAGLLAVTLVACLLPARRAMRLDPARALRAS